MYYVGLLVCVLRDAPAAMCILKQGVKLMAYHGPMCAACMWCKFSVKHSDFTFRSAVHYRPVGGTQGKVAEVFQNGRTSEEKFVQQKTNFVGVSVWILFLIHGKFRSTQFLSTLSKFRRNWMILK